MRVAGHRVASRCRLREQLDAAAQAAIHAFGRIDTWINNAGVSIYDGSTR